MMNMTKDDFFGNIDTNDWIIMKDIDYAYTRYHDLDITSIEEFWFKKDPLDIFLLNIQDIGDRAYYSFLIPALTYIKKQSSYWDENFYEFDGRPIDDSALSAFELLPELLERRFNEYKGKVDIDNKKQILNFISWALLNIDKFNMEFLNKEELKEEYKKIKNKIIELV